MSTPRHPPFAIRHAKIENRKSKIPTGAFSLVELLVVIAIIAILAGMAAMSGGALNSSRLQATGQTLAVELDLARQLALGMNLEQEVRFWKIPDATSGAVAAFRAVQTFTVGKDGALTAASKLRRFDSGLVAEPAATLSSLLAETPPTRTIKTGPVTGLSGTYDYMAFRFRPDGSTDLEPTQRWSVTIQRNLTDTAATQPGPNRFTIEIEPVLGSLRVYRP